VCFDRLSVLVGVFVGVRVWFLVGVLRSSSVGVFARVSRSSVVSDFLLSIGKALVGVSRDDREEVADRVDRGVPICALSSDREL